MKINPAPLALKLEIACALGLIAGVWISAVAPLFGSTPIITAIVITIGSVAIVWWDFRKAVHKAAQQKTPPTDEGE